MLDLRAQYTAIREEIRTALEEVLAAQQFILGPQVAALEEEIARFCGARFAVGVASGTDALLLALRAAGVGPGDEVIVPAFSYIATADAVSLLGARPVFADIRCDTFNLDEKRLDSLLTPRTRAIVPVHLYGQPAEMDAILELAARRGLPVLEDNAQAIGARYHDRPTGSLGTMGCLSFYPTKNLGGYGDGGMILTNDERIAATLRAMREHGARAHKYVSESQGYNSRLDEIQAAILRVKLRHLGNWQKARQAHAARYNQLLGAIPGVTTPCIAAGCEHVFHQYTIRVAGGSEWRDRVQRALAARGVASMVYYPVPLHRQPMFVALGFADGSLSEAERAAAEVLSLPIYPELTAQQIEHVAGALREAMQETQ
jgi:dTDP-4-amino-4,6-dideoxygalactose transaminase